MEKEFTIVRADIMPQNVKVTQTNSCARAACDLTGVRSLKFLEMSSNQFLLL